MGGKTKQTQRTKNNAKPSNSGRSAELLGASVPSFVGFSAHSDLGMVPFAPGFGTTENLPETFDSNISTQFQLILRKMSKKDPITKAKALQEFIDLLTESEVDIVKGLLPLWPKFYHNLANDVDHRVREGAQNVQNLIVSKCKKAVAPYLKQLVPVWLSSQFDNYPPAASVAVASFQSVFAANKTQEVCMFCQQEILDYVVRNLTFHTASTLTSAKSCTPEEAEHKYQQVVSACLKTMSFFLDKTAGSDISQSIEKIHGLLAHQKFWSFSKHKTVHIKSAWFELLYNVLQYTPDLTKEIKGQMIPLCFQNIDDSDPLIVPHVWGCVLLLQSTYDDWHKSVNFKKNVHSKLSTFLRNACSGNAETVCPNLLPLLSKITQESLQEIPLDEFYKSFFTDIKEAILSPKTVAKSDVSSLTSAYYECLRFILQKLSTSKPSEDAEPSLLPQLILDQFIIHPIILSCHSPGVAAKYIFLHTSTLIAYWSQNSETEIYSQMLNGFWSALTTDVESSTLCKPYLDSAIDLVTCLYTANPNLQSQKVKFSTKEDEDTTDGGSRLKSKPTPAYVQTDLRKLVVLLVRQCLDSVSEDRILHYETQIHSLIKLYGDAKFYAQISGKNDMAVTLTSLANVLSCAESEPSEVVVEIVFEILNYMEKDKKLQFIDKLLETKKPALQQCLLQRLLSYPMCVEPEVRVMLSQDHVIDIILQTANEVLEDDSKEKFNLLHKCFFQTDSGDILINQKTVDGLLDILSKPLTNPDEFDGMTDPCGSFIAQIMPVVCSNSSEKAQKDIFLKLFRFTIDQKKSDDLSEDTLWEITTCWQDALSSEDIIMDDALVQNCAEVISTRLSTDITPSDIDNIADIMSKLILCSTENIEDEEKRYERIDLYGEVLFKPVCEDFNNSYESVAKFCSFIEAVRGSLSLVQLADDAGRDPDLNIFFRRSLLNLSTILKCCVNVNRLAKLDKQPADDEECTEDYFDASESLLKRWTDTMCQQTLQLVKVAALGESLVVNWHKATDDLQTIMLEISEKAKLLLRSIDEERVIQLKSKLLLDAAFGDVAATRVVPYLVVIPQYSQFQENALILVLEDMTDYFITRKSLENYVNLLQFVLRDITDRVINADNPIVKGDADSWQKCAVFRCLIDNNFSGETNNISDRSIIAMVLDYITAVSENQKQTNKEELLYNTDVTKQDFVRVTRGVEYINLLTQVLTKFPYELTIKNWDAIRLGLSSWLLSVSKSMQDYKNSKVAIFVSAVYSLHAALALFIKSEKEKSSTEALTNMIDEWETLFAPEINIVLFKSFYSFVSLNEPKEYSTCFETILQRIEKSIWCLDYSTIFKYCKTGKQIPLDDLTKFVLEHMSSSVFSLRITAAEILSQLTPFFIACDMDTFEKTSDIVDGKARDSDWHFMSKFKDQMRKHEGAILKYLDEFTFKLIELPEMKPIDRSEAISYMFLWEYVINVCAKAPVELRSVYTSWLTENKFDQNFLNFLFRAMPVEILKNHDSKLMSNELFKGLDRTHSESEKLAIDKYACHLYAMALSKLPAVVRKWWNGSHSRQKVFVDKLTTNFVSGLICYNELESIAKINMKEKHNNMQVTVHTSTREVNAVYFIDEARMELIITLAPNYPLGGVKVESGKQIGGRASSRNIAMQLTIFLTHQNGSIFDGLSLWKKNLDKKFEGVEECYVCYTVIHQDTCQLPKLTCKTCRKKFHSPCLYKWFTTSSKSTCPICRNIF